jgi:uncharacterized protein YfaS (alpha-2-macroglobulin family)
MSSFLPNVIVAQTLKDVKAASLRTNDLPAKVQKGLDRLYGFQHDDGGWGWWKDDKTNPFMTAYVVDGLWMASRAGFSVDQSRISRGRAKLEQMISSGTDEEGKKIDLESRAFMVYTLNETGEANARYSNDLFARRGELQPYGRALLALTLNLRREDGRARQVAGEIGQSMIANDYDAHWESKRAAMLDFAETNDIEATALSLKALSRISPQNPSLVKVARWLVMNRRNGYYWDSTKQTAFAIFGLVDYVKASRELSPDYTFEVYVNGQQVASQRVTAANATSQTLSLERKAGDVARSNQIRVVKRGSGVLYLSTTLGYFTREEDVTAQATPELRLTREYLRLKLVDRGSGEASWSLEPLAGEVRSGDIIVSRLRVQGTRAQYLMIEDPIPAGCEQVEQASGIDLNYTTRNWSDWYSQREFRDNRTVFFASEFDGDITYQYAMRVEVPGDFRVAPARAELMYRPLVRSNTASARLSILERK